MGNAHDGSAVFPQHPADHRAGQGGKVSGGFVQDEHVRAGKAHLQKKHLRLLSAGQFPDWVIHLVRRKFQGAQVRADPGALLLFPRPVQVVHRGLLQLQQLLVILRHVGRADVAAGQKFFGDPADQGGLSRPVFPDDADLLPSPDAQENGFCQFPAVSGRFQRCGAVFQDGLPRGHPHPFPEPEINRFLRFGTLCHFLALPFIAFLHGLDGPHLLFEQIAAVGILPGDASEVAFHLLLNFPEFFLPLFLLPPFGFRPLLLAFHPFLPPFQVFPVGKAHHAETAFGFSLQPFHMHHRVGRPFDERFVMGNEQHRILPGQDQAFQPLQSLYVDVVGGLVQQQYRGLLQQEGRHLGLHLFPSGKAAHPLIPVKEFRLQPKLCRQPRQLPGRLLPERGTPVEIFEYGLLPVPFRQLLGEVSQPFPRTDALSPGFRVIPDQLRIVNPFQQRALPVSFLSDDHGPVPGIETEPEILHDLPEILLMNNG